MRGVMKIRWTISFCVVAALAGSVVAQGSKSKTKTKTEPPATTQTAEPPIR
jgi:hypothetical protein